MRNNSLQTDIADLLGAVPCETKPKATGLSLVAQDSVPTVLAHSSTLCATPVSAPCATVLVGDLQPVDDITRERAITCKPLFDRMIAGESVRSVMRDLKTISRGSFWMWLYDDPNLQSAFDKAMTARSQVYAEQLVDLCDDTAGDYVQDADGSMRFVPENVQRSRLKVDTRKWIVSKLLPKRYGERLEVAGDAASPLTIVLTAADDKL